MEQVCWESSALRGTVHRTSPACSSSAASIPYPATAPSRLSRTLGERGAATREGTCGGEPGGLRPRPAPPHLRAELHPGPPAPRQEAGERVGAAFPPGAAAGSRLWVEENSG